MKKFVALVLAALMLLSTLVGCGAAKDGSGDDAAQNIDLSFFTGKVETVDLIDEIIADYNAQSNGITAEQEYQNDASNIIKIKFASGESPDVMTTYEQEFVDQGKYMDLGEMSQWWDRLIPSMKESCTDLTSGKQFRVCTNMTMAGFFYNKEIFDSLNLTER